MGFLKVVIDIMEEIIENNLYMGKDVIFMGTPQFAVPVLDVLLHSPHQVLAVYTQPDKPVGRKRQIVWSPVKRLAMEYEIPVIQPEDLKSAGVLKELADFKPELIIVAAFGQILPQSILSLPQFACLNVHPSLLPRYRGPSPVASVILRGDAFTGVSIMLMDAGMDSGPILAQAEVDISTEDTTDSLTAILAGVGASLLFDILPRWLDGKLKPQAQDDSLATYCKSITGEDSEMDWHIPAVELWRRIRAYDPWPGCHTWFQGKRLRIHRANPVDDVVKGREGEVIELQGPPGVGVITGRGILRLWNIQLEGKHEMPVDDFIRGKRDFIGSILGRMESN